jgi:alpha-galactosidase
MGILLMSKISRLWLLHVAVVLLMPPMTFSADVPAQLPRPDGRPAEQTKPIKVYIMMGQSNMLGFGRVGPKETRGTLEFLVREKGKYPHLVDDSGNWITRQDVRYVHVMDQRGVDYKDMEKFGDVRNEWLTPNKSFGPELGFGQVIGTVHDEPVLLLKACIGNRSLGWDLLPPGSERFEFDGKVYAGYKDVANFWESRAEESGQVLSRLSGSGLRSLRFRVVAGAQRSECRTCQPLRAKPRASHQDAAQGF